MPFFDLVVSRLPLAAPVCDTRSGVFHTVRFSIELIMQHEAPEPLLDCAQLSLLFLWKSRPLAFGVELSRFKPGSGWTPTSFPMRSVDPGGGAQVIRAYQGSLCFEGVWGKW